MELGTPETVLRAEIPLAPYPERVTDDLLRWAREAPLRPFIAQRDGDGWTTLTFADAALRARRTGAGLLGAGGSAGRPLAVIAENGIEHAVAALAATYAGIPAAPLSTGYVRAGADPARLRALFDVLQPFAAYVPEAGAAAFVARAAPGLRVLRDLRALEDDPARADRANAEDVRADTTAKVLFTSGSTGTPKGVVTTHRMLCANQTMLAQIWPDAVRVPVLVDWAPWSHTAGGSKIFGIALRNGGTYYVDEGKPAAGAFAATLRNLGEIAPTFYFSVPRGWALLAGAFERDARLATTFFSRVRVLLNAAASIPEPLRLRLAALAARYAPAPVPVVSCWGATETAPMATAVWGDRPAEPDTIGTPVPGVEIKLAAAGDLCEMRVRAVTVTPGYWRDPVATSAAFDEDGFYRTGDAAALRDPGDPSRGIVFGGRLNENFKLSTGTWVNVGAVRAALLDAGAALLDDVVLAGEDRDELGALLFVRAAVRDDPAGRESLRDLLIAHNLRQTGGSTRIARAIVLGAPPDAAAGEITDKGSVNQRRVLRARAADVARLYAQPPGPETIVPGRHHPNG